MLGEHCKPSRQAGFTLIEVVIALFVLALALVAATELATGSANNVRHLERVTYAHWVAMNRMGELELQAPPTALQTTSGTSEMAGRRWYWRQTVSKGPQAGLMQVDIRVRARRTGSVLASLQGILGNDRLNGQNMPASAYPAGKVQ